MPKVLLVDDSATVRRIVRVYLLDMGLTFREAEDGRQALSLLRSESVDLILSDIEMPEMDGVSLLREVRALADERLKALPFVLLTSVPPDRAKAAVEQAGANDYLVKPVSSDALRKVIERHLELG